MIKETKGINQKKNFEIFNNQVFNHSYHTKKIVEIERIEDFCPLQKLQSESNVHITLLRNSP